jgi:hypothetical protein
MSCVIRELPDDNDYDPDLLERQLGLALVKGCDGDPSKLLVTVLDFLRRRSNFFKHGDPRKRVKAAFDSVAAEAGLRPASGAGAAGGAGAAAAAPAPATAPPAAAADHAPAAAEQVRHRAARGCARRRARPVQRPAASEPGREGGPALRAAHPPPRRPSPRPRPRAAAAAARRRRRPPLRLRQRQRQQRRRPRRP